MNIHLMSDLHIESHYGDLLAGAGQSEDTLCLVAGDWANGQTLRSGGFANVVNPNGIPVLAVLGNHDWYELNLQHDAFHLRRAAEMSGVHILDRDIYEFAGWRILGCTLWSNFELYGEHTSHLYALEAQNRVNDFRLIRHGLDAMSTDDCIRMYRRDYKWLDEQLTESNPARTIVMTHFAPHKRSVHPAYQGPSSIPLNPYFCNNTGLIEKHQPALWVHGHTHQRSDYTIGNTRVMCNPRGYSGEHQVPPFDENLLIGY